MKLTPEYIKLVSCKEIQDRWVILKGEKYIYPKYPETEYLIYGDGMNVDRSDIIFLPSLEWLMNECEKEIEKIENYKIAWNFIDEELQRWMQDNPSSYPNRLTAWAEYLLHLIRENKTGG